MARITIYASAFAAAFIAFAVAGGIGASEQVVRVEEHGGGGHTNPPGVEAIIPHANGPAHGGNIRAWRADGADALYVQDGRGRWYRATLAAPCRALPMARDIRFLTQGGDRLDRASAIRVEGQRCALTTLRTSGPPPHGRLAPAHRKG